MAAAPQGRLTEAERGSLVVVGTGIRTGTQLTPETQAALRAADDVFYLVTDPMAAAWFERLVPHARSLLGLYDVGKNRGETYAEMVETILEPVRRGHKVCAAFYGHPGVFVLPSHEAVARARAEGLEARMLPAVSAEDCLFAELGVDPASRGCLSYEATDLLIHSRTIDPSAYLVLWQIAWLGNVRYSPTPSREHLPLLVEYLERHYPPEHEVILYEASPYPVGPGQIRRLRLADLPAAEPSPMSTLCVPPGQPSAPDPRMLERLGLPTRREGVSGSA